MLETPHAPPEPEQPIIDEIDAGVINDARARQRRHRAGMAIVIAALGALVLAFSGGSGNPGGRQPSGPDDAESAAVGSSPARSVQAPLAAAPTNVSQMGLLAPGVGWAANTTGLYLTRDGGRSWRRLELPGLGADATAAISDDASASSRSLLLTYSAGIDFGACGNPRQPGTSLTATALTLTSNVGRTWRTYPLPGCPDVYSLGFANARFGAMAEAPQYPNRRRELYVTYDGGQRWYLIGRIPFFGQLVFGNAHDGLGLSWQSPVISGVEGTPLRINLYRTNDGGHSWQPTTICRYPAHSTVSVICQKPVLLGPRLGYVPAVATNHRTHQQQVLVYATSNGGKTWVTRRLPPLPKRLQADLGGYVAVAFSAPDARHLFALVGANLYRSSDGGRSWTRLPAPKLATAGPLDFASDTYGWTMTGQHLYATNNGGRTWKQV
jgi:photosystem II stability/assembly factor-like uncharacterized protein